MALRIAALSQKGGVGKSTIARAIAAEYARHGWSVKIADMDLKQKTSSNWNAERLSQGHDPKLEVQAFASVKDVLKQEKNYDLIVFDGAGQADLQTLEIAKNSHFIILPSGLSKDDLIPQIKLAHELVKKGLQRKNIGISLSRVGTSERELTDAIEYIKIAGYSYLGRIDEKSSISQAMDNGLAAHETKFDTVNKTTDDLLQNIVDCITALEEAA